MTPPIQKDTPAGKEESVEVTPTTPTAATTTTIETVSYTHLTLPTIA